MSKKFILIVVAVTLCLVAAVIWWLTKPETAAPVEQPVTNNTTNTPEGVEATVPVTPPTPQEISDTGLKNIASRFVEIYGSYSSDANFANLKAVETLITGDLKQSIEAIITAAEPSEGFYGVTTKALLANIESQSVDSAVVIVKTQRQELFSGQGEVQLRYQDIRLSLVRSGDVWLVNRAEWQAN